MFFQNARKMNRLNVKNLIAASSLSLFLKSGKAAALPPGKRFNAVVIPPKIKKNKIKIGLANVTDNCVSRKDCVLSQIHDHTRRARPLFGSARRWKAALGRTPFLTAFSGLSPHRSSAASLTVEAALELPIFFVLIAIVLQYACVMRTAAQFSGSLTTTAQEMAVAAYKEEYGDANNILRAALSDAWASAQVINTAEDRDSVRLASFLNSSYMKEGNLIKLVLSYQPKPKYSLITLPFTFFVQKAAVRGWVGKNGYSGRSRKKGTGNEEDEEVQTVLVTEHGSVYHTNPDCPHLKVTIIPISKSQLNSARNTDGEKYKRCPYCGNNLTGNYYIDPCGNRWHTSVDCPALKRTVHEVDIDECGHMHECKDCRAARGG